MIADLCGNGLRPVDTSSTIATVTTTSSTVLENFDGRGNAALGEPTKCHLWEVNDDAGSISSADCRSLGMLFLNATERRTSSFKHDTKSAHVSAEPSGPDFPTSHLGLADLDSINQSLCVT